MLRRLQRFGLFALKARGEDRARLLKQRDELETERNELALHCTRMDGELTAYLEQEQKWARERAELLAARDTLERERNEQAVHCARLERELAASHGREQELGADCDRLMARVGELEHERNELAVLLTPQNELLEKMRREWDRRAAANALHYTNSAREKWEDAEYCATGEYNVAEQILTDMPNICRQDEPGRMRMIEIGCGAGRMTRALARIFGQVHAVDISAEMIAVARERLAGTPNVFFYQTNGMDLSPLPAGPYDFAFSYIVFQHIPSRAVIESYMCEVHRLLKPGALFKFQVQGYRASPDEPGDTWFGADFTLEQTRELAARTGFDLRFHHGEGTQDFWLWFFRR